MLRVRGTRRALTLHTCSRAQVITPGAPGAKKPLASTPCSCHYTGKLIDGTVFDSSVQRGTPATFAPNQVIKGWTQAMQLMSEGAKARHPRAHRVIGSRGTNGPAYAVLACCVRTVALA
jgi:FKBP-type peptidyl-prolyl cis-trans isomerase